MGVFGKNEPVLAGKGISCKGRNLDYGVIGGRASLRWGDSFENASNDPKCPAFEPDYGDPNLASQLKEQVKTYQLGLLLNDPIAVTLSLKSASDPVKPQERM